MDRSERYVKGCIRVQNKDGKIVKLCNGLLEHEPLLKKQKCFKCNKWLTKDDIDYPLYDKLPLKGTALETKDHLNKFYH
jgi:hypothetical protein